MVLKFILTFTMLLALFVAHTATIEAKIELTFAVSSSSINTDQSLPVDITISGVDDTSEYYIRGVFFQPNTSGYFGYTQNNADEWVNSTSDHTKFYKITGNGTSTLHFKPDSTSTNFQGTNTYHFKVSRYTVGGSQTWSEQIPAEITITHSAAPTPNSSSTPTPTATIVLYPIQTSLISLSEIYACAPSGSKEWIEIKNNHTYEVSLQNWFIRDNTASNKQEFTLTIPAGSFGIIETNNLLNNTGDAVKLFTDGQQEIDNMTYSSCSENTSLIKENNEWKSTLSMTKASANVLTLPAIPTPTVKLTPTPTPSSKSVSELNEKQFIDESDQLTSSNSAGTFDDTFQASISGLVLGSTITDASHESNSSSTKQVLEASKNLSPIVIWSLLGGGGLIASVGIYLIWEWYNNFSKT